MVPSRLDRADHDDLDDHDDAIELAEVLDVAARGLISDGKQESVAYTLELIVAGALSTVPHVERAGICFLRGDGSLASQASSDEVVAALDASQDTLGEGPTRDALRAGGPVTAADMTTSGAVRWPRFAAAASQHGIAAACSLPLFARHGASAGALTLYGRTAMVDDVGTTVAGLFASNAALALHGAQRVAQLTTALTSRDVIGQAKGILMQRFGLDEDQAFAMLVEASQQTNLKLHAVAVWLADGTRGGKTGDGGGSKP